MSFFISAVETHYLNQLISTAQSVHVFLKNGIKLQGILLGHDAETLFIEDAQGSIAMLIKSAISTVCPLKA